MIKNLRKNISNVIGWSTKRKLIIFESDDWGSVRTRSKDDYNEMLRKGINIDRSNFTKNDGLESNDDLTHLFDLLSKHTDYKGRNAVFTPMCVVANPNFDLIRDSNFQDYHYESFIETCKRYPNHDQVPELWLQGIKNKLFVPQFHGREHLNVARWMKGLQNEKGGLRILFDHQSIGATSYKNEAIPEHLAAFNPENAEDIFDYNIIIKTGLQLFEEICGYKARYFVASNSSEPKILEKELQKNGIEFLTRYKFQKYPLGNGKFESELNWLGKKNKLGQIIITRNSGFEPSDPSKTDWVNSCLEDIKNAFYWNKPAVISTHRVNYVSEIVADNGQKGLAALNQLLVQIKKNWPEAEFITTEELGDLIKSAKDA